MPIIVGSTSSAPTLATQADVEAELGRALTSDETAKVDTALAAASDYVRTETRRKFEAGTFTVRRRARDGRATVYDASSVSMVNAISSDGTATAVTGYTLRGTTLYGVGSGWIEVTYTSDGTVPEKLVRVVAAMAARDITNDRPQGATSYTVSKGPFTESAGFDEPNDAALPTPSEARIIAAYRARRSRSVSLL